MGKVSNTTNPDNIVYNPNKPLIDKLLIELKAYPNWYRSCNKMPFTNKYKDDKHISKTLSVILFKIFPYLQDNINGIIGNKEQHCHKLNGDAFEMAFKAIESIHGIELGLDIELWQLGVTGGIRVIGMINSDDHHYTLYPLLIDCNHLLYPSEKHNKDDFKKFKKEIKM